MGQPSFVNSEIIMRGKVIDKIKVGGIATEIGRGEINVDGNDVILNIKNFDDLDNQKFEYFEILIACNIEDKFEIVFTDNR